MIGRVFRTWSAKLLVLIAKAIAVQGLAIANDIGIERPTPLGARSLKWTCWRAIARLNSWVEEGDEQE
ncbi:MAG: hypothetical protein RLP02_02750 [Coleofasciculus sp. C2-GNP5-27]